MAEIFARAETPGSRSVDFFSEKSGAGRVVVAVIGFCRAIIVIQPGRFAPISLGTLYLQGGAFLTAIAQLMLKMMFSEDGIDSLVAWNLVSTVPVSAIQAATFRTRPKPDALAILAFRGIFGTICMIWGILALALPTLLGLRRPAMSDCRSSHCWRTGFSKKQPIRPHGSLEPLCAVRARQLKIYGPLSLMWRRDNCDGVSRKIFDCAEYARF
ncbi:MAG: hypothetical protein OXI87_18320 [Albidovulum sp.]|nr:hypothetical protein [Albidovulum sp.]